jgi:Transposase
MATQRRYSIEFKRQVVQEYQAGETLHGLAKRHGISRNELRAIGGDQDVSKHDALPMGDGGLAREPEFATWCAFQDYGNFRLCLREP